MYRLTNQFSSLGRCFPAGPEKAFETEIYEHLLELMEISGKIVDVQDPRITAPQAVNDNAYVQVMNIDRQLQTWYRRLPAKLTWNPTNIRSAPSPYFLLHQQFHCSMILLHRPWAKYEDRTEKGDSDDDFSEIDNDYFHLSSATCTRQAVRVAQVFWHHRQTLDIRKCCVTGLQHAGTAATALVAALAVMRDSEERMKNMRYLQCLALALRDMGPTYHPADAMSNILQAVMAEMSASGHAMPPPIEEIPKMQSTQRPRSEHEDDEPRAVQQRDVKRRASSSAKARKSKENAATETSAKQETSPSLISSRLGQAGQGNGMPPRGPMSEASLGEESFVMVTPRSEGMNTDGIMQSQMPVQHQNPDQQQHHQAQLQAQHTHSYPQTNLPPHQNSHLNHLPNQHSQDQHQPHSHLQPHHLRDDSLSLQPPPVPFPFAAYELGLQTMQHEDGAMWNDGSGGVPGTNPLTAMFQDDFGMNMEGLETLEEEWGREMGLLEGQDRVEGREERPEGIQELDFSTL
jgi:hypothetical protein